MDKAKHKLWHQTDWSHSRSATNSGYTLNIPYIYRVHQLSLTVLNFKTKVITLHFKTDLWFKRDSISGKCCKA